MASLSDDLVQQLLGGRYIASLGTQDPGGSTHMVAVWFWFDGTHIFIATSSRTRKSRNLQANPKASLMVDSRDPAASFGTTISGSAEVLKGETAQKMNANVHRKYLSPAALADSKVGPVFAGWDDLTIKITPESVVSWDMRALDKQALQGAFAKNPEYLLPVER